MTATADPAPTPTYRQAVEDALNIVSAAHAGDAAAAQKALAALESGTGRSQPEIVADLAMRPPDFEDAGTRLRWLLEALASPAATTNPAQAQQQLHQVLSMHRYDALRQPPTLLDRLGQWVRDRINDLLRLLFGGRGGGPAVPTLYFYILGAVVLAAAVVIIFRSTRGRLAEGAAARSHFGPGAPADFFADADRLAAAGDRVRAIRALCAGVAATLAGEQSWTGSPLTVREIFQHAPDPSRLSPLRRGVDAATYERALAAAAPFRKPTQEAAA